MATGIRYDFRALPYKRRSKTISGNPDEFQERDDKFRLMKMDAYISPTNQAVEIYLQPFSSPDDGRKSW
jgi:hypothetical protein